jgi:hypothetical protein
MDVLGTLPARAVVLLALLAGTVLVGLNYGWLLAAKEMLGGRRRKDGSTSAAPHIDHDEPTRSSAP